MHTPVYSRSALGLPEDTESSSIDLQETIIDRVTILKLLLYNALKSYKSPCYKESHQNWHWGPAWHSVGQPLLSKKKHMEMMKE